jgi:hypothetical protein
MTVFALLFGIGSEEGGKSNNAVLGGNARRESLQPGRLRLTLSAW